MQTQDRVKALAFGAVLGAWALLKLGPGAAYERPAHAGAPPTVAAAAKAPAAVASDVAPDAPIPEASTGPAPSARPAAPAAPSVPTPDAVRRELELQAQLESDARAYARALVEGDLATVQALLAGRCGAVDVARLVDRRRVSLSLDLGVPLGGIAGAAPLIGHFDAVEGVAHAFLGFESGGRALFPRTIDGWLYESGHWRNAECT